MTARLDAAADTLPAWYAVRIRVLAERLTATPAIPVLLAVALGLFGIGDKSLWVDEGISIAIARMPGRPMIDYIARQELVASSYYVALKPWLALGQSEAAIRSLSVLFGALAVLGTWLVARRYGVAFRAALVMAVLPTLVAYMQQAKGYTLLVAVSAFSTWLLLRLIDEPTRWRALLYVGSAVLIAYVNPLGAFIPIAHAGIVLVQARPGDRRRLLLVYVPIVISWIPIALFAIRAGSKWAWIPASTPDVVASELIALGGGVLVAALLVICLLFGIRRDALTIWLLVPLTGALLASVLIEPVFRNPYLMGVLPAAAVIAARSPRPLIAALVVVALAANWTWYQAPSNEDWRGAAAYVQSSVQVGDGIIFEPTYDRPTFGYYARVGEPLVASVPWSESDLAPPGETPDLSSVGRIWFIDDVGRGTGLPADVAASVARRPVIDERDFIGQIRVVLLGPDPTSGVASGAGRLAAR